MSDQINKKELKPFGQDAFREDLESELGGAVETTEYPENQIEGPVEHLPTGQELANAVKGKLSKYSDEQQKLQAQQKTAVVDEALKKEVEGILEDGLFDLYTQLPAAKKQEFKQKGEEVATRITLMLQQAKLHARKIVELIKSWLVLIPGVRKYFLEQEAKIKADKIINLSREEIKRD